MAAVGPLAGWLPYTERAGRATLLAAAVSMAIFTWALLFVKGRACARG